MKDRSKDMLFSKMSRPPLARSGDDAHLSQACSGRQMTPFVLIRADGSPHAAILRVPSCKAARTGRRLRCVLLPACSMRPNVRSNIRCQTNYCHLSGPFQIILALISLTICHVSTTVNNTTAQGRNSEQTQPKQESIVIIISDELHLVVTEK